MLSAFPSFARSLGELGIRNDGVATTRSAGGLDPARELSPQMRKVMELANTRTYRRFLEIVAEGRGMPVERVAELAEGRVWTGAQAAANGLVDHLGNLVDAVAAAAWFGPALAFHPSSTAQETLAEQLPGDVRVVTTDEIFAAAWLRFLPGDGAAARARIKELLEKRSATQPLALPNAGSVFRNPPGDHAARLIEAAGLKGMEIEGARVSEKHANFVVNPDGKATAGAIESLIGRIQAEVREKFGVELVREVRILGARA